MYTIVNSQMKDCICVIITFEVNIRACLDDITMAIILQSVLTMGDCYYTKLALAYISTCLEVKLFVSITTRAFTYKLFVPVYQPHTKSRNL